MMRPAPCGPTHPISRSPKGEHGSGGDRRAQRGERGQQNRYVWLGILLAIAPWGVLGCASVPKGVQATFTPDQGFSALAWTPGGPVRFQYEVQLQGPKSAVVVGHGDLNGDGVTSEYKLPISGEGPIGQMEETNPLE